MLTRNQHATLWSTPEYLELVTARCAELGCDGCTGVPDFYLLGCLEHDIAYATGLDPQGNPITKSVADERFKWYIQEHSVFGRFSPMAWWRYRAVRRFGDKAWRGK